MQQNGQDKNPAAWYYLGRDLPAAGRPRTRRTPRSRKAEQLAPDCAKDIAELPPERLGRAGQGGQQVRGGQERRLRARALPAGGLDLPRLADRVLPDCRDLERQGTDRQRRVLLRAGRRGVGQRDRHDRDQGPQPLGVQSGRAAAQRQEVRPGGRRLRAVPQVGARTTTRPSAAWRRPTAARQDRAGAGAGEGARGGRRRAGRGGRGQAGAGIAGPDERRASTPTTTRSTPMPRRRSRRWWRRSPTTATRCPTSATPISR